MKIAKAAVWICFLGYTACLLYWMFLGFHRSERGYIQLSYNLVPFRTIANFFIHFSYFGLWSWMVNILGNIGVFVPFGWFMPLIFNGCKRFGSFSAAFVASIVLLELLQMLLRVGSGDIDDVILNYAGAAIGYGMLNALRRRMRGRDVLTIKG
ncbi:VanZ family protein [Paenibacillus hamazuiensis]|uniref:VanZ family protein n=1 Tax=Paenibacillus hamazuiensis TaxID=2936508 RepID=UPI00200F385A|nr:VanZ family protein [Paenibacillus hamazuiensis]